MMNPLLQNRLSLKQAAALNVNQQDPLSRADGPPPYMLAKANGVGDGDPATQ